MTRVVTEAVVDAATLAAAQQPRSGFVLERAAGDGVFDLEEGPFRSYRRTIEVDPRADGGHVRQTVDFKLNVPYFGFLFLVPVRRAMGRIGAEAAGPEWWAPPARFDARAAGAVGTLAAVMVLAGYLAAVFTETVAFAGDEFHAGNGAQGAAGAIVRTGGILALLLAASADRRGRRRTLLLCTGAGCLLAATGAAAPSLAWLAASQTVARAFAVAIVLLTAIVAVEEMPAGARAYATGLITMAFALGSGLCSIGLVFADLGTRGWRLLYLLPLLGLLLIRDVARRLPETRRYLARATARVTPSIRGHVGRLALLAGSLLLVNLFNAPDSQFSVRYLRDHLDYSGARIALLTVGTGTPAALGVLVGGRLADVRGRRLVAAVAIGASTILGLFFYVSRGWSVWAWAFLSSIVGAASVPALAVYGPELFPTGLRGKANGIISVTGLAGSAIGLAVVGVLADAFGSIAPAMAVAAAGPLLLAALILVAYPETAGMELETLNPEDVPPPVLS